MYKTSLKVDKEVAGKVHTEKQADQPRGESDKQAGATALRVRYALGCRREANHNQNTAEHARSGREGCSTHQNTVNISKESERSHNSVLVSPRPHA